jgi:hypothetical protein
MEQLKGAIMFGGAGLALIAFGVTGKRGHARTRPLYMKIINPLVAPVDGVYAAIPVGIGFVLIGIGLVLDSAILAGIGLAGGTVVGFVFIAWKPCWMKPNWLLWLEEHYEQPTIRFMFAQVRRDRSHFKKVRSCTQEELYAWAEEMAHKYEQLVTDPHTIWEQYL